MVSPRERSTSNKKDVTYFFLLNVASGFMLSAAHNVLYHVFDIRALVVHFLHHFFTFLFMLLLYQMGCIPKNSLPIKPFLTPVLLRVLEIFLSHFAHSGNRTGGLYVIRVFDCLFAVATVYGVELLGRGKDMEKPGRSYLLPLSFAVSLSWLEFGQMEHTSFSLLCAPLLAVCRGLTLIAIQRAYSQTGQPGHKEQFCLFFCGFVSLILFVPAVISYSLSSVEVTASWESIDYVLMSLSFIFMSSYLYSDLWLSLSVHSHMYCVLDHTKYLGASIAQWMIQNMAHPNILALAGKIVAFASLYRIYANY